VGNRSIALPPPSSAQPVGGGGNTHCMTRLNPALNDEIISGFFGEDKTDIMMQQTRQSLPLKYIKQY